MATSGSLGRSSLKNGGVLPDTINTMRVLEEGLSLTKFSFKKRPEKKMVQVKLETRQLVWYKSIGDKQGKPEGVGE